MASTEPALDVYTLFPLPVPAPSSTAAVFEAVRRLSPAEMPNVPQLAKTPEDAAAAVSRLESTAGATGYITSGLCQYDLRCVADAAVLSIRMRASTICWLCRSAYFSPQKALYNPHAIPPYPNVAPLDNISKFRGSVSILKSLPPATRPLRIASLLRSSTLPIRTVTCLL